MANPSLHANRSKFNYQFEQAIVAKQIESKEWRVIALFYSALHAIETYLSSHGSKGINHENREVEMKNSPQLEKIVESYLELQRLASRARYKPHLPINDDALTIASGCHDIIITHIQPLVEHPLK